jgi:hypothetical protein
MVEVLVYDQNRFIRSQIKKRFKEVKEPLSKEEGYHCCRAAARYQDEQSTHPYQIDGLQTRLFLREIELHYIKKICQIRTGVLSTMWRKDEEITF